MLARLKFYLGQLAILAGCVGFTVMLIYLPLIAGPIFFYVLARGAQASTEDAKARK